MAKPLSDAHDIYAGVSYVLIYNWKIAGVTSIIYGLDPTYLKIDGQWKNRIKAHYATLHRVAVSSNFRGAHLSDYLFSNVISQVLRNGCHDIRIDTHPDNKIMQHLITSQGFQKAGIIQTEHPGQKATNRDRLAYQLTF